MANIKVVSERPLFDGMAITFNAPCECNLVNGLTVSYHGISQKFVFRDAHGNNLTGLGNLFAEGAYVKAILDTENSYAYLQNADTNAYLEGRFTDLQTGKAGFIYPLAGEVIPNGFLLCDGAEHSRTEYPELFEAIGTLYGEGDGSTTFNVPNLSTRVPVGAGDGYNIGDTGGEETHTLTVAEMPAHIHVGLKTVGNEHSVDYNESSGSIGGNSQGLSIGSDWNNIETRPSGEDQPHNNMQPYTVVNYVIATGKKNSAAIVVGGRSGGSEVSGGYYVPIVTQPNADTMSIAYRPSHSDMPFVEAQDITLPQGPKGEKGDPGVPPIVNTVSGETVSITDSAERPLQGLTVFGKTTQATTTGKNLLNLKGRVVSTDTVGSNTAKRTLTGNQIFVGISADNYLNPGNILSYTVRETSVTVMSKQGAYGIGFDLAVTPGNTYAFSVAEKSYMVRCSFYQADGTHISFTNDAYGSVVYTAPNNAKWVVVIVMPVGDTVNKEITFTNLQFELGTVATAYEPYGGGTASPNPEFPQDLVNVGNSGSIAVSVMGKNLFGGEAFADRMVELGATKDATAETIQYAPGACIRTKPIFDNFKENTRYTIVITGWNTMATTGTNILNLIIKYADGKVVYVDGSAPLNTEETVKYTTDANNTVAHFGIAHADGMTTLRYEKFGIFEGVITLDEFEPYKAVQTLSIPTPNGLPGIPVTSGGNYTDQKGQQWVCDEIDLARGVYVQRIGNRTFTGDETDAWIPNNGDSIDETVVKHFYTTALRDSISLSYPNVLCTMLKYNSKAGADNKTQINVCRLNTNNGYLLVDVDVTEFSTLEAFKAFLAEKPMTVSYVLASPIETPLADLPDHTGLHTHYPSTTVMADGAGVAVTYVADTKNYIDKKFAELSAAIINN